MMADWEEVHAVLAARGFTPSEGGGSDSYCGTVKVGSISVELEVVVRDFDFVSFPAISVRNTEKLPKPLTAHLRSDGTLCYADEATFILDRFQPGPSVLRAIEQAVETLRVLLHGNPTGEILAELPAYWGGRPVAFIDDPSSLTQVSTGILDLRNGFALTAAAADSSKLKRWEKAIGAKLKLGRSYGILHCSHPIVPPAATPSTFGEVLEWAQSLAENGEDVAALSALFGDELPGLFVSGPNAVLGFVVTESPLTNAAARKSIRAGKLGAMVLQQKTVHKFERLHGVRADKDELVQRNFDGPPPLAGKRIALIGCGTIGSLLARPLVQSGAGHGSELLLADSGTMAPGNVGRHALGVRYLGRNKAEALAEELGLNFPDAHIETMPRDARTMFSSLASYDLVIDATGNVHFSQALNAQARERRRTGPFPPVIYAMIFGNGIAVQTFLESGKEGSACFKCLKPTHNEDWRYSPIKAGVETTTAVRPCGFGSFAPFGVEASNVAANLALRHTLDVLAGKPGAGLRTRVIDSELGRARDDKTASVSDKCPVCNLTLRS